MGIQLKNNAVGYLATAISASDVGLVLQSGNGANFPSLTSVDYFYATLESSGGTSEIVKVTARSGDSLTIVRAQESTTANSFAAGSRLELRVTAGNIEGGVYTPAGVSVPSTIQAKLREVVSVMDFGATGNGTTDDTAAIQAAINYAQAGVNTVYFPAGTYKTSSSLTVTRSVSLIGAGAPCTTIRPTSALTGPCVIYGVVGNIPRPGTTSCEISGLTFDGSSTTNPAADGIRMWCSHLEIHNNSIREFEGYGIHAIEAYSNVVRQNWIYGNTKTNILVGGTGNAFVIQNNYILNSLEHGIWLQGSNKAIVQNNDIENNTLNGVKIVQSGVQAMRETYVGNNYFENNSGVTVEDIFVDALASEITGLVIENNYHETAAVITVATIGGGCYINNNRNATLNFTNFSGSNVTCFGQAQGNYDTTIDNVAYSNFVQTDTANGYQIFGRQAKFRVFSKNAGTTNEIFNCYTVGNNANGFLGGSLKMKQIAAADAQTDSVYVSSADGKLYFKNSSGTSFALY